MSHIRLHAVIYGVVQGVGYRAWCAETASLQALTGWVRNIADGSVEVVAEGPKVDVVSFMGSLYNGPKFSSVSSVKALEHPATGEFKQFTVLPTSQTTQDQV